MAQSKNFDALQVQYIQDFMEFLSLEHWELFIFFLFIALLYSSVGFGGGSSYLAVLALFGVNFLLTRSVALICNITVVAGSVLVFHQKGLLDWRKSLPLVLTSVPMAFAGGYLPIKESSFYVLLGGTLFFAGILTWFQPWLNGQVTSEKSANSWTDLGIGASIGFLSGMVGIGGGIFLSPVLYLLKWAPPKQIAAVSSLFILVNSVSGLAGQLTKPDFKMDWAFAIPLMVAVLIGGQAGARNTSRKLSPVWVRRATAILILYVSTQLLIKYL